MRTDLFDYDLPRELIAALPAPEREESRLLVVHREDQRLEHRRFSDIGDYLRPGDLLVVNDSRVLRARLHGQRMASGGAVELLLLERVRRDAQSDTWRVLGRPGRKLQVGEQVRFGQAPLQACVAAVLEGGEREVTFNTPDMLPWLERLGEIPLPPYIVQRRRELGEPDWTPEQDAERYQTVYAREPGSVAAPTAGLHFSQALLEKLQAQGVELARVTLHVGAGTFKPVETENVEEHPMHTEQFTVSEETAEAVNRARAEGRRVVGVGTTSVRTLESACDEEGHLRAGSFDTNLMILPGYRFRCLDALVTNFHLPRSTLLMLVSAFAGRELILRAYAEAIAQRYRFYSYGDAMLIV